jgi:hypothetical protein
MRIDKIKKSAFTSYDVDGCKKISDKFNYFGKIGFIMLKVKSHDNLKGVKLKIGKTILTEKELVERNCPYHPDGEILLNSFYMQAIMDKEFIDFEKDDVLEFEQQTDTITKLFIYFIELEKNAV